MIEERIVEEKIFEVMEEILNYAQVACPPANWPALRSKILRIGNEAVRNLTSGE